MLGSSAGRADTVVALHPRAELTTARSPTRSRDAKRWEHESSRPGLAMRALAGATAIVRAARWAIPMSSTELGTDWVPQRSELRFALSARQPMNKP